MNKFCCICKNNLSLIYFHKNKSSKDGHSNQCKSCAKKYRDLNKDKRKNYKSTSLEYRRAYYNINKDHINKLRIYDSSSYKLRYSLHKDKIKLYNKKYYLNNKQSISLKQKQYRKNNISILMRNVARRNLIKNINISMKEIENLLNLFDNKCYYCGIVVKRGINLHLDHKVPLSRNGQHVISNLVPSCATCNLRKGTKTSDEFLNIRGNECL